MDGDSDGSGNGSGVKQAAAGTDCTEDWLFASNGNLITGISSVGR